MGKWVIDFALVSITAKPAEQVGLVELYNVI